MTSMMQASFSRSGVGNVGVRPSIWMDASIFVKKERIDDNQFGERCGMAILGVVNRG
jgi:hypothetical protein